MNKFPDDECFFVVSGMHRSHTSLLGRMLVQGGLRFHSNLVGANQSNPYGHYEDVDFLVLQKAILASNGAKWFRNISSDLTVDESKRDVAHSLIEKRRADLGNGWGFKNPQSTLFLDFWEQWPEARFLLIFREPRAVMNSIYRRMGKQIYWRPDAWIDMARACAIYNRRVADFRKAHPQKTFLINSADLLENPARVLGAASQKIGLPIDPELVGTELVDRSIKSSPASWLAERLSDWAANREDVRQSYELALALSDSECDVQK